MFPLVTVLPMPAPVRRPVKIEMQPLKKVTFFKDKKPAINPVFDPRSPHHRRDDSDQNKKKCPC